MYSVRPELVEGALTYALTAQRERFTGFIHAWEGVTLLPFAFRLMPKTALLLCLCLMSACVSQTIQIPSLPPAEEGPHDDPARDAQLRLLIEAQRAFQQARYATAILFFTRFIERAPDSPRLAEARWWLGRAHEQNGNMAAAMAEYRVLASSELPPQKDGSLYEGQALRRLDELRQAHPSSRVSGRQVALSIEAQGVPPAADLKPWLQALAQDGVTVLVIDMVPTSSQALFNRDRVKDLATEAHALGLLVWAALDVHQPQGLELQPAWMAETGKGQVTSRPDVAHPDYQAALESVVRTLARSGCDGLFLPARPAPRFAEEWSSDSLRAFASSFGLSEEQVSTIIAPTDPASERTAMYWRWAGWKARSYAKMVARLRDVFRETTPGATVLMEVHQATVDMPLAGLDQYGEDLAELAHRTGSSFVVTREDFDREGRLEKLGQQLGTRDRVWRGMASAGRPKKALLERPELGGWNVFVMPLAPPAIP